MTPYVRALLVERGGIRASHPHCHVREVVMHCCVLIWVNISCARGLTAGSCLCARWSPYPRALQANAWRSFCAVRALKLSP